MNIPIQIDNTSISRAQNVAHYEYLATVRRRTDEIRLGNVLWHRADFGKDATAQLNV